jgi:hypothetical protein
MLVSRGLSLFDFGDSWHVALVLRERVQSDGGAYPRVLEREGTAPPQYPDEDADDD